MFAELRAGFILLASLVFLIIIVGICAPGLVMMPERWRDRTRFAGAGRMNERKGLSVVA